MIIFNFIFKLTHAAVHASICSDRPIDDTNN